MAVINNQYSVSRIAIICSLVSSLVSFAALYLSAKTQLFIDRSPQKHDFLRRIHTRDVNPRQNEVGDNLECNNEPTSIILDGNILTSGFEVNQLICKYTSMRSQFDRWVDEFNSVLYFINEIGVNMQEAKEQIETNSQHISKLLQRDLNLQNFTVNSPTQLNDEYQSILNMTTKINQSIYHNKVELHYVQTAVAQLQHKVVFMNSTLHEMKDQITSSNNLTSVQQVTNSSIIFGSFGENQSTLENRIEKLEQQSQENALFVGIQRNSLGTLRSKLTKFAADDWFNAPNGYQYFLSKNAFRINSYKRSRRYCLNRNSDLAYVGMRNQDVFRFLWNNLVGPSRHHCIWLGLTDLETEGVWKWMDGQSYHKFWNHWAPGRPGRISVKRNCAMIKAGMWVDGECSGLTKLCSFLCERKIIRD